MTDFPTITLEEIAVLLPKLGKTLILTHINPDGDCLGTAFGLAGILKALGCPARVACPSPMPNRLRFLAGGDDCLTPGEVAADGYDSIVAVDVASPNQLGDLGVLIPRVRLLIDHHGTGTPFAPYCTDPTAAAAGEIVFRLWEILKNAGTFPAGCGTDADIARCLYAAIVSDTGGFQFSNTTPETLRAAAALCGIINADAAESGKPDTAALCRMLLATRTRGELTAQMLAVKSMRFYEDGALAAVIFTRQTLEENGISDEDIGSIVDIPRSVEGVLVALVLKQMAGGADKYRVSSRANVDVDCATVCAAFGGGGHRRAAGCTITATDPEEALRVVSEAFAPAVRDAQNRSAL